MSNKPSIRFVACFAPPPTKALQVDTDGEAKIQLLVSAQESPVIVSAFQALRDSAFTVQIESAE